MSTAHLSSPLKEKSSNWRPVKPANPYRPSSLKCWAYLSFLEYCSVPVPWWLKGLYPHSRPHLRVSRLGAVRPGVISTAAVWLFITEAGLHPCSSRLCRGVSLRNCQEWERRNPRSMIQEDTVHRQRLQTRQYAAAFKRSSRCSEAFDRTCGKRLCV